MSRKPAQPADPALSEEVLTILRKTLSEARLHRVPRHPRQRDVVLSVLCLNMRRRYPYTEIELNELIGRVLLKLQSRVDHVTLRRYLVDFGFVKRDRAGTRYFLNYPKVEITLSADAISSADSLLELALKTCKLSSRGRREEDGEVYDS